ncbi:MAG: tetratricopeptide repeat protein [Gammaproteobacteria bacterium]|nr:tetratricopeptide repeat protein [Gammaproteobacteria bacterium]
MKMIYKITSMLMIALLLASCGGKEERMAKYLEKGKDFLEKNNIDKARVEFKNVLQIDPKHADAFYYIGMVEEKDKNLRKAIGYYSKATELDKTHVDAKVKLAKIYVIAGTDNFISEAKVLLDEIDSLDSGNDEAQLVKATIFYKSGDAANSIATLEKVLSNNKSLTEGISLLATLYLAEDMIDKSINLVSEGVKNNPSDEALRIMLARIYSRNQQPELAEVQMKAVVKQNPDEYKYRAMLASFYASIKQLQKAEDVLRKAITDDPDDADRYLTLVEFQAKSKSVKVALEELESAIQNKPELYGLKFALVKFYRMISKSDNARQVLNDIIKDKQYEPEGIKAKTQLVDIFVSEKNYNEAEKYIAEVLNEDPNNNDALFQKGRISLVKMDPDNAINALRTVIKNDPKNATASSMLANAHMISNNPSLADDVLRRSIEANPVDYNTHLNFAQFLQKTGKSDEALSVISKALLYFKDSYELYEFKLNLLSGKNDAQELKETLDEMKLLFADNHKVFLSRGRYFRSLKQYDEALNEFNDALDLSVDKYIPFKEITTTYILNNSSDLAIAMLNDRIKSGHSEPFIYELLGVISRWQKKPSVAIDYLNKAIELDPKRPQSYMNLASLYTEDGNIDQAIAVYKSAIQNVHENISIKIMLASVYERNSMFNEAISVYNDILTDNPENIIVINNLVSLLIDNNPSQQDINRAVELTRGFEYIAQPAMKDTLGWVYVKAGQLEKAVPLLNELVTQLPQVAIFNYHLGVALNKSGESVKAKEYLQRSVDSDQEFIGKDDARKLLNTIQ